MNLRNMGKHHYALIGVFVCSACFYPFIVNDIWLSIGTTFLIYSLLALSQDIVLGRAGVYDMGHIIYFGMGAYIFAICVTKYQMGFFPACTLACFIPAVLALILSAVALHLKGDYFLLVSIGYNAIFTQILTNNPFGLTNGPNGIFGVIPAPFLGLDMTNSMLLYYYGLGVLLIVVWLLHNFDNSRFGRAVFYMNQDELAALSMGINPYFLKLMSFMFSGIIAGFAGVLFALEYASVSVETFEISQSIILFAIVIVGGQGSIVGVLVGTFIMFVVPELIRESAYMAERMGRSIDAGTVSMLMKIRYLIFGFLMVILMIFRPNGLIPVKFGFYPKKFFKGGA